MKNIKTYNIETGNIEAIEDWSIEVIEFVFGFDLKH